jgi:hypothetical protein
MATEFFIQTGNPRTEPSWEADDASLSDAIQSVFPLRTEDLVLVWNGIYVPLGYKYDVSFMVDDVIDLAAEMMAERTGGKEIHWPSNTFAAVWDVRWDAGHVSVAAKWTRVVGGTEMLLAASGSIRLPVTEFLGEWKRPLEVVSDAMHRAGYSASQIPRLAVLDDVVRRLPQTGQLYEHGENPPKGQDSTG